MLQLTIWSAPSLLAMLVSAMAYQRVRHNELVPGVLAIRWLFIGVAVWSLGQLLATVVTALAPKVLATQLQYIGIAIIPVAWFSFALSYAQSQRRIATKTLRLLSIVPVITLVLVFTNSWHHWIWRDLALLEHNGYTALTVRYGTWFRINVIYSYGLIFAATSILAFVLNQTHHHRGSLFAVIIAPMVVASFNILYLSPFNPVPWIDPTPLSFALAGLILHRGVLAEGLLDRVPVMRHRVVEQLKDPIIIVNEKGFILDLNPAAELFRKGEDLTQKGRNSQGLLTHRLALAKLISRRDAHTEITLGGRAYDVNATPLECSDAARGDIVLVFHDITNIRAAEHSLLLAKADLQQRVDIDHLTQLYNRRFFMQRLEQEMERVRRHGNPLSVLLFDLDHFKRVNDGYGHDVGDLVLQAVSGVAKSVKRITDVAARLGGEEFAILLPETNAAGAAGLARRLCKTLQGTPVYTKGGAQIRVTASVGVATVSSRGMVLDNLLSHADKALYRAKNGGRNMVCCADV